MNKLQLAQFFEDVIASLSITCRDWERVTIVKQTSTFTDVHPVTNRFLHHSEFICDTIGELTCSLEEKDFYTNILSDLGMDTGVSTFKDIPIEKRQLVRALWLTIVSEMLELEHQEETKE